MINKQILLGNIGTINELKGQNKDILEFSVATEEIWKNDKDEWQKETEWHNVKTFGSRANYISEKACVGDMIYIEGKAKTESWEKDGVKHSRKVVIALDVRLLPRAKAEAKTTEAE